MYERQPSKRTPSDVQKAQFEVALILAIAKGKQDELDLATVMMWCTDYLYLQNMSEQVLLGTLADCHHVILAHGDVYRINEVAQVIKTPDQRLETMDFALKITFADYAMQRDVNAVLKMLQTAFELSDSQVNKLLLRYL